MLEESLSKQAAQHQSEIYNLECELETARTANSQQFRELNNQRAGLEQELQQAHHVGAIL